MDKEFEEKICRAFFGRQCRERLMYELSSEKKRREFFNKMSHTAENYLGSCICEKYGYLPDEAEVTEFLGESCYFIAENKSLDGKFSDTRETLALLRSEGGVFLAVNAACDRAYLETEFSGMPHNVYFLEK